MSIICLKAEAVTCLMDDPAKRLATKVELTHQPSCQIREWIVATSFGRSTFMHKVFKNKLRGVVTLLRQPLHMLQMLV